MRWVLLTGILAAATTPLPAQVSPLRVTLEGVLHAVERFDGSEIAITGQEDVLLKGTGVWTGARLRARAGFVSLEITALTGSLDSETDPRGADPNRRFSSIALWVHPTSWLAFGSAADAWRSTPVRLGVRRDVMWRRLGVGTRLTARFGISGLEETIEFILFPVGSVAGEPEGGASGLDVGNENNINHRVEVGISYASPAFPFVLGLAYRVDRFSFCGVDPRESTSSCVSRQSGPALLPGTELVRGLVVRAGLHFGR